MAFAVGCAIATSYSATPRKWHGPAVRTPLMIAVNANGLGTDIWSVPFDNITTLLKVKYIIAPLLPRG